MWVLVSTDFMKRPFIVIAGASGVVGRHLVAEALTRYDVKVLTRKLDASEPKGSEAIVWNPQAAKQNDEAELERLAAVLSGARAVVNLAGASIGEGRFNEAHKALVLSSRLESTETLSQAFLRAESKPNMWFQASAIGFYGDRGDELLTEASAAQEGFFLSDVSVAWEQAAAPIAEHTRLVIGRLGVVLAKDAPAWQKMLLPIKLFVGGPLGSGQQWYAWIDADDVAKIMCYLIADSSSEGVFNLVSPNPVRQLDLAKAAAKELGRPAFMPVPGFALKIILGEAANYLLLTSAKVLPERLSSQSFAFDYPTIEAEMKHLLK